HPHQTIESERTEPKTASENTTRDTRAIKVDIVQRNTIELKENTNARHAASAAFKED
ncbi:hypothetical protein CABS01_16504, partial [Colletotrichum abscissum]|uniref:uncharacterized protein n=1 Tax=Colletotrichum abscissum TaxID=1671311 RepID=UPI0027D69B67